MAFDERGQADNFAAPDRDLLARLQTSDRARRLSAERHHLRSEYSDGRDRPRGASQLRGRFHRSDALDQSESSRRASQRRRQQHFVFISRQQHRARSDALRRFFFTPFAPGSTWESSTPDSSRFTKRSSRNLRERVEDVLLNRRDDATERLVEFAETRQSERQDAGQR